MISRPPKQKVRHGTHVRISGGGGGGCGCGGGSCGGGSGACGGKGISGIGNGVDISHVGRGGCVGALHLMR
jgi:hypothetical protein